MIDCFVCIVHATFLISHPFDIVPYRIALTLNYIIYHTL
jgi:hypothetical protein